jgi:alkylation response protein AidB-like acyl-CoA dehydrogenase
MAERGWLTMAWPREYGGQDAPIWRQVGLKAEMTAHHEPRGPQYMSLNWIGPSIMMFGTEDQKHFHLGRIALGGGVRLQGFSEPDAGSDLASLRTRATRDGDEYVIGGEKIWTSHILRGDGYSCWPGQTRPRRSTRASRCS